MRKKRSEVSGFHRKHTHQCSAQWLKWNGHPVFSVWVFNRVERMGPVEGVLVLTHENVAAKMELINKIQNPYVKIYGLLWFILVTFKEVSQT